ncbi:MAG TPA: TMEM14 family protein [Candidatus Limnocylindria bacterium]|jgi:uncharacterized membrane protein (UPF0136 family)|nr:TMEM14 family protein [Candidatus Limnocylindria bacterium]
MENVVTKTPVPVIVSTVLWVYVVLLFVGGLIGFLKGKSKISLISSTAFAIPLAFVAAGTFRLEIGYGLLGALVLLFFWRWRKSGSFMPAGMLFFLTAVVLAVVVAFKYLLAK